MSSKNNKSKIVPKNRNEVAVEKFKKEQKEKEYGNQVLFANKKLDYVRNIFNARYYSARCDMITAQINSGEIKEQIDGCPKSEDYMRAEYGLMHMQAILSMMNANSAKDSLVKDFKFTEEDLKKLEKDYYEGSIIREKYDDAKPKGKAEFVNSSED